MNKKAVKLIPILLIINLIVSVIITFTEPKNSDFLEYISMIYTLINMFTIPFLVFYVDLEENQSDLAKIGFLAMGAYVVATIAYKLSFKGDNLDLIENIHKIQQNIASVINALKYIIIVKLISVKTKDDIAEKAKVGAVVAIVVYYLMNIIFMWVDLQYSSDAYKIISTIKSSLYDIFEILVFTFVIYQLFAQEEEKKEESTPQVQTQTPSPSAQLFAPGNTPKFRNPALEEQEKTEGTPMQAQTPVVAPGVAQQPVPVVNQSMQTPAVTPGVPQQSAPVVNQSMQTPAVAPAVPQQNIPVTNTMVQPQQANNGQQINQ